MDSLYIKPSFISLLKVLLTDCYIFLCVCAYGCVWMCVESMYMHKYSCMKGEARKSTLWVLPQEPCALLDTNPAWSWDLLVETTLPNVFIAFLAQNMQLAFHFSYRFPSVGIMGFWNSQDALEEHRSIFLFSTPRFPCLGCCSQNLRWRHVHCLSFYLGPYFSLCGGETGIQLDIYLFNLEEKL